MQWPKQFRRVAVAILIAAGAASAAFGLITIGFFDGIFGEAERKTLDWRMRAAADPPRDKSEVALILFDEESVKEWPFLVPFPRMILADIIDVAANFGAKAIGLDVFLDRLYEDIDFMRYGDQRLRESIANAGNVIIGAETVTTDSGRVLNAPHPYFSEVAAGVASTTLITPFETIREGALLERTDKGLVPSFALALYAKSKGLRMDSMLAAAEQSGRLELPGLPARFAGLPSADDPVRRKPILFMGPPSRAGRDDGAFRVYSSSWIAFAPPDWFRDKIVLLGTGFHAEDRFRGPFYDAPDSTGVIYGWIYGIEVHAATLDNLLMGRHPVPLGPVLILGLLLLLALMVTGMVFWRGVGWGAGIGVLLAVATAALAVVAFGKGYLHVPIVGPTLALAFSFLGSTTYVSIIEGKEKRVIRGAFAKYVSPAVVDQLVADPSRLKLGGEKRSISILFSDLAGFTSLSETMDPEKLLSLLNQYLDQMAEIVLQEGGTLDKYIGDAVMAFWGAPAALPDHALRACRTALRMQRRLSELDQEWAASGLPELHMRIGVNTGAPVVGNIGGEKRFDYTALGDAVNLAARLEPACKSYHVEILISHNTRVGAGDAVLVRELDLLAVYGKREPVPVYELLGLAGDEVSSRAELLQQYDRGLAAFRNRDFELALQYFQAATELDPNDGPSQLYVERCHECILNPPPADWDFVERRTVKG